MTQVSKGRSNPVASFAVAAIVMAGAATTTLQAKDWYSMAGPESTDREARLWPSCRTNAGCARATAFAGPFPRMSAMTAVPILFAPAFKKIAVER
jgi:hypothetical protein